MASVWLCPPPPEEAAAAEEEAAADEDVDDPAEDESDGDVGLAWEREDAVFDGSGLDAELRLEIAESVADAEPFVEDACDPAEARDD